MLLKKVYDSVANIYVLKRFDCITHIILRNEENLHWFDLKCLMTWESIFESFLMANDESEHFLKL